MKEELFAGILESGRDLRVRVTGGSMAPALRDGDYVTLRKCPSSRLRRGDLVLFRGRPHGQLTLHRLTALRRRGTEQVIRTRGDSLLQPDRAVPEGEIMGRVIRIERGTPAGAKVIETGRPLRRAAAWLRAVSAPLPALARRAIFGSAASAAGRTGIGGDDEPS